MIPTSKSFLYYTTTIRRLWNVACLYQSKSGTSKGLNVNFHKSTLLGIDVPYHEVECMALNVGCKAKKMPFNYLGVKVGADSDERKATWISWKKVLASKLEGGLRVIIIFALNLALLYKWVRRFRMQPNAIWTQVVRAIYDNDGLLKESFRKSYPNSIWVTIIKAISSLKVKGVDLMEFFQKKVSAGQEIKVVAKLKRRDGLGSYRRLPRRGIEEVEMMEMCYAISFIILSPVLDTWVWTLDGSRSFTVGSARRYINKKLLISGSEPTRWCKVIPQKVNILAWRISLNKLPTRIHLDVRGFDVPSILCPICGYSDSDVAFVSTMVRLVSESSAKEDALIVLRFRFFALVARVGS
nr:RNA-directed DNA polymerase, eukaryota, reverse transcriptase zinc-binding domain protein [Tanacetum cinerariifolium]